MGFFGGSKKGDSSSQTPGAQYVGGTYEENLPVAIPIEATVVSSPLAASAPPMEQSYTTTTVYPPDGSFKQPYAASTQMVPQRPLQQTFVTTIPAPQAPQPTYNMLQPGFRRAPTRMPVCPSCQQGMVRTQTRTHPTLGTWIAVVTLLILFWPICWIPLVCDVFKQTDHYCSHCGVKVAEVSPFQDCCEKRRG
ncbi:hypothetical protein MHU86_7120 [Fragilaria crotonensis]|nr:hypothetical protein MHU86_7120 [Fragilaria crotonensis]